MCFFFFRALLLGLSSNPHISDLYLDISGCEVHHCLLFFLFHAKSARSKKSKASIFLISFNPTGLWFGRNNSSSVYGLCFSILPVVLHKQQINELSGGNAFGTKHVLGSADIWGDSDKTWEVAVLAMKDPTLYHYTVYSTWSRGTWSISQDTQGTRKGSTLDRMPVYQVIKTVQLLVIY